MLWVARDSKLLDELSGPRLARLDPRVTSCCAEAGDLHRAHFVREPRREGLLRTDHDQVGSGLLDEGCHLSQRGFGHVEVPALHQVALGKQPWAGERRECDQTDTPPR